jgi:DNA-binding SARP family transcriptional activator/Tfp pilus assembly protein PilF
MRFGILGPLLVHDGKAAVSVPGVRMRALLAALLMQAGQPVSAETLTEIVWDGSPPPGASDTLRTHVMRLRRVLGPLAGQRLVTRYPGYLVDASEDEVDLLRFSRLCREGGAAVRAGMWPEASQTLTEALGLWRGKVLADVPARLLQRETVLRLDELRVQAQEWRVDADLNLGRHADLVSELHSLAAEHPLRERFHAQLMLALYRCGRQADALTVYRSAREMLVEELGAEPGRELRELHQRILAADRTLASPERDPGVSGAGSLTPHELPRSVPNFVGRDEELAALTKLLELSPHESATVVISAIGGTAGVGKTALAVHWAHLVADRFPDGQLHVNLRGYDLDQPVTAADALAGFLRALGVSGQDIPADEAERTARYCSLLAGKRILILLDNAGDAEQVRPLLPAEPGCAVVVTSRDALAGLVARDGAARLDLDVLPHDDAVALLRQLIGIRASTEPDAVNELAELCCRLPLALRIAAELAATRPAVSLSHLRVDLTNQQRRLDLLTAGGDPRTAVRAVFSWSYQHLDTGVAHAFRLAGLHPGPHLDAYALAALTGTGLAQAQLTLNRLAGAHLAQPGVQGRYIMHDLLRGYARGLAESHDGEEGEHAALTRLFDHYLHTAATAMDTLYPAEKHRRPRVSAPGSPVPPVQDPNGARAWLDDERESLAAIVAYTAEHGWPSYTTRLAVTLFRYLYYGAYNDEARAIHGHACRAARKAGDSGAEAIALTDLGSVDFRQGRHQQAGDHFRRALELFSDVGDLAGQARALGGLGVVDHGLGRYQEAAENHRQALDLHHRTGDRGGEANALNNLGSADQHQGRYEQAGDYYGQALAAFRETGHRAGEAMALDNLGTVARRLGRYEQASRYHLQALALYRQSGDRTGQTWALTNLALVDQEEGRYEQAADRGREALVLCREAGDLGGEAEVLNSIGRALTASGRAEQALRDHGSALGMACRTGSKIEQAIAHDGLGRARQALGHHAQARAHWEQALTLYAEVGSPEAENVRAELDRAVDASDHD